MFDGSSLDLDGVSRIQNFKPDPYFPGSGLVPEPDSWIKVTYIFHIINSNGIPNNSYLFDIQTFRLGQLVPILQGYLLYNWWLDA